jgi:hypothetical protein
MNIRIQLFRLITRGVPPDQILPWWAVVVRSCLFPLDSIGCRFYNPLLDTYTIRGQEFSGAFFDAFAAGNEAAVYRFTRSSRSSPLIVHRIQLPLSSGSLAELQSRHEPLTITPRQPEVQS